MYLRKTMSVVAMECCFQFTYFMCKHVERIGYIGPDQVICPDWENSCNTGFFKLFKGENFPAQPNPD